MTTADVAEYLGVSVRTVARMADDGRITPKIKFPGETGPYLFTRTEALRVKREQEDRAEATS